MLDMLGKEKSLQEYIPSKCGEAGPLDICKQLIHLTTQEQGSFHLDKFVYIVREEVVGGSSIRRQHGP